ncbi:hypothetical protein C8R43DRAFT_1245032 [Mycena crocata]|nr:hypothetical protein C8R43DRAFT_1245032 [Mycena crocata]
MFSTIQTWILQPEIPPVTTTYGATSSDELERPETERQELEKLLESFVYPVLTVPPELINKIFIECVYPFPVVASKRHAPLSLPQICRREERPDTYDSDCKLMRMWFHRAGATPLSIRLTCSDRCEGFPPEIFSTIAEFSQRWGRLEVELPSRDLVSLGRIPGPFHLLHTLGWLSLFHWSNLTVLGLALPSLTTLEIGDAISVDKWNATLRHLPKLQHFRATLEWQQVPLIELRNLPPLETLIMSTSTWGTMDPLPALTLPYLRRLRHKLGPSDVPSFLSFVHRSKCALEYLSLSIQSLNHDSLMSCLLALPSLVTLKIHRKDSEPKFYKDLESPDVLSPLCELSISESGCYYPYDRIIAMLHARRAAHPNCARLRSFKLQSEVRDLSDADELPLPNAAIVRRLERLAADDIRIRIPGEWTFWPENAPDDTFDFFYRAS